MTNPEPAVDFPHMSELVWQFARFPDLRPHELYAALQLREAVFVVEQKCPYADADGRDPDAWHLLGWLGRNEGGASEGGSRAGVGGASRGEIFMDAARPRLVAYARIFEPGVRYTEASIGRVVTAQDVRRYGFGKALMAEALRRLETVAPRQPVKLAAQRYLERFYSEFGFRAVSEPYEEDGIPHVDMIR